MKTFTPDEIDPSLPQVVRDFLASGKQLEEIKLDARGKWTHEGLDFENPRVIKLFSRSIARTDGGTWVLDIPPFTYPIEIEDTAYFVEHVSWQKDGSVGLVLSDETTEVLDPSSVEYDTGGRLYCRIKQGKFRARFKRQAYYNLVERAEENQAGEIVLTLADTQLVLTTIESEP